MELKCGKCPVCQQNRILLIVPCGIEMIDFTITGLISLGLLIVPCGIEIKQTDSDTQSKDLLIVPCGIEIS